MCFVTCLCAGYLQAEAMYEDDEMAGGFGSQSSGTGTTKIPFRAEFKKENEKDKK